VPPALAPPRSSEKVALFDLDLTLLDVNTGRLWCASGAAVPPCCPAAEPGITPSLCVPFRRVEKEFREGKVPFQIYLLSVYWFAKYAAGLGVDSSEVAREAMAIYGGQSSAAMAADVEAFWAAECEARVRPGARAALAAHRAAGERCVLCTASWQHVAAMARRSLALDGAVCSILHVGDDGCFTGGVSDAYGESKAARTAEWAARENVDLRNCTFYTDSYTDTALMELVGTPVAVCPDSRLAEHARKRGWRTEDWGEAPPSIDSKPRYTCAVFGMKCM
jgi:HAD superfamily hydrolase (TIGR01490 family)